jgi:hypothetical protein
MVKSKEKFVDEIKEEYHGFKFVVKMQRMGHRCGYVQIPDNELFQKIQKAADSGEGNGQYDIICHGGITFVEDNPPQDYLTGNNWIGFDCYHAGDDKDITSAMELFDLSEKELEVMKQSLSVYHVPRSKEYVKAECIDIINQLEAVK